MNLLPIPAALSLLATQLAAQVPTMGLDDLARRVAAAHRPSGPTPAVEAFRCTLEMHLLDKRQEQGGQADLAVQFLNWRAPGSKRVRTLIRYEVQGGEQRNVRGTDQYGPWHLHRGKPEDLTGAEFVEDLAQFREHTNLARQLVRFLSPGQVLLSLQKPGPIVDKQLRIGRARVPCRSVSGTLADFPLMQNAGKDTPAKLEIYVDAATDRLLAVDAWPLVDGEPNQAFGERIVLFDLHQRDGLLVPRRLDYLWSGKDGALHLHSRVKFTTLELRPELKIEDFDRR